MFFDIYSSSFISTKIALYPVKLFLYYLSRFARKTTSCLWYVIEVLIKVFVYWSLWSFGLYKPLSKLVVLVPNKWIQRLLSKPVLLWWFLYIYSFAYKLIYDSFKYYSGFLGFPLPGIVLSVIIRSLP
jgi:hypothetical protein